MSQKPKRTPGNQRTKPPRIEYLRVENYRALKHVELKDLTPITVLLGPNGSGKSTVFDVFAFLSECFEVLASEEPGTGVAAQKNSKPAEWKDRLS